MEWQPQTNYPMGSQATYQGVTYTIIQPHTSQVGWEPPNTPALWNRIAGQPAQQQQQQQYQPPQYQQQQPQQPQYQQPASEVKPEQSYQPPQEQQQEEHKKQNFFSNPITQIAAGLVGAAAVAGIGGVVAYKFSKDHNDDQKRQAWLNQATIESQSDMNAGRQVFWMTTEGSFIPPNAIQLGTDGDGSPLYAARSYHDGGVVVGKANNRMGFNFGYVSGVFLLLPPSYALVTSFLPGTVQGGKEHNIGKHKYQVLCGNPSAIHWLEFNGPAVDFKGRQPITGGQENDGRLLYVAVAFVNNGTQVGKAAGHFTNGANVPYGGKEVAVSSYRVACL
ncbi:hypothetical protein HDU96_007590 [Phlyctochytrium bullatum]|nr:hypothetical protein HDU96_007590 [Phlyctochytrium bullatum]